MNVVRARITLDEVMSPGYAVLTSVLVANAFQWGNADRRALKRLDGNGYVNNRLRTQPWNRCAPDMLDTENVCADYFTDALHLSPIQARPVVAVGRHDYLTLC
jgi:hypothetical protein